MNVVDVVLILILLFAALGGFFRGFVHSILAIFVWAAAVLVTLYGVPFAAPVAEHWTSNPTTALIAAGAALFIGTLVALTLVRHQIAAGVRHSPFGALDRSLGFVFGVVVGVLLICVVYFGTAWALGPRGEWPDWAREAKTLPLVESTTAALCRLGPDSVRKLCRQHLDHTGASPSDLQRQYERLTSPPVAPGTSDSPPGYPDRERRGMDRLFEQNR